jgi:hypothetical protein
MAALRDELSIEDLISITGALRKIKPNMKDLVCVGVEVPQPNDQNVVFHVISGDKSEKREASLVLISAEFILEMFGGTGNVAERDA